MITGVILIFDYECNRIVEIITSAAGGVTKGR